MISVNCVLQNEDNNTGVDTSPQIVSETGKPTLEVCILYRERTHLTARNAYAVQLQAGDGPKDDGKGPNSRPRRCVAAQLGRTRWHESGRVEWMVLALVTLPGARTIARQTSRWATSRTPDIIVLHSKRSVLTMYL